MAESSRCGEWSVDLLREVRLKPDATDAHHSHLPDTGSPPLGGVRCASVASAFRRTPGSQSPLRNPIQQRRHGPHEGARVRIVFDSLREARSHGVLQNIARDDDGLLLISENVFERISLPEFGSKGLRIIEAGILLRPRDELLAVRRIGLSFDQQVKVIGHEAVRNYRERVLVGSARNLLKNKIDGRLRDEY